MPRIFGATLRQLRIEAGMSLADLEREVFFSKSHLSKVENGHKTPSPELARKCDLALGANGALVDLVQTSTVQPSPLVPSQRRPAVMSSRENQQPLPRALAEFFAAADQDVNRLTAWHATLRSLRVLGQTAAPTAVAPMATSAADSLGALACEVHSPDREEALILASRFAEYAGWMYQEAGDNTQAIWWTERAVELAEAAGDNDLAAYALVRKGLIAMYGDDAMETVHLASRAQTLSHDPHILALAAQREAQGHALGGDALACMRTIDRAAERFAQDTAVVSPEMVLGSSTVANPLGLATGWCLHDLGDSRGAAEILTAELALIPVSAQRARSRWGARLALSLAGMREIDEACAVVEPVLRATPMLGSATIRKDLRRLSATLTRWSGHDSVRRIAPVLTAVSTGQV